MTFDASVRGWGDRWLVGVLDTTPPHLPPPTHRGDYGQLGTGTTADSLKPALVEAVSGRGVLSLSCGQYHSCVATSEAGLLTFGKNDFGQCGVQNTSPRLLPGPVATPLAGVPVIQTTAGYYHTTILTASGSLFAFGRNDFGACTRACCACVRVDTHPARPDHQSIN